MDEDTQRENLSASEAAAQLTLSHAQFLRLLEQGGIRSTRVAQHVRVDAGDLSHYRQVRQERRGAVLDELAAADAEYLG